MAKYPCPGGSFALGPSKLFTCPTFWYWLSLVLRSSSYPAFHHHVLDVIFQPAEVLLNVQIPPGRAQGSLHLQCPYRLWSDTPYNPNPSFCPLAGGFTLKPWKLFRYCLTITEVIDCTNLQSSPGTISSCTELSGAKNDMTMD